MITIRIVTLRSHIGMSTLKIKPSKADLNPICHLLSLLGTHPILHIGRIRVNVYEAAFAIV
jgi:hypothetical protein